MHEFDSVAFWTVNNWSFFLIGPDKSSLDYAL
jgi:hypothetical protein